MGQEFEEWDAARTGSQIFPQERFGEPVVLSANGLVSERLKSLSCRDEASQLEMKGGEQAAGFSIVRIDREQFFEGSGRPAILAGVHVIDGFFQ